jgi:N-hydroxyarylamine O-acetyltransferase
MASKHPMNLRGYFERIGYHGRTDPSLETLLAVHRAHALAIPYENLDVVLEVPVDQSPEHIYEKIVGRGRGGWCYEMNGLLGWALGEIGFHVTRLSGAVMRVHHGDDAFGNHLVLRVDLEEPWIADVGIGDGILEAIPLRESEFVQGDRRFRLEQLAEDEWRFHNREGGMPPSFDFRSSGSDEARLAATCASLQSDPESMFRQNLVSQRMTDDGVYFLLGRMLTGPDGGRRFVDSEQELIDVLTNVLGITVPVVDGLWQSVVARHEALFGTTAATDIDIGSP